MKIELNALIKEWASYNVNLRNLSENSVKAYSLDLKDFLHQGNLSPLEVQAIIPCPVKLSLDFPIFFVALQELFQFYSYILNNRLASFFPVSRKLA